MRAEPPDSGQSGDGITASVSATDTRGADASRPVRRRPAGEVSGLFEFLQ